MPNKKMTKEQRAKVGAALAKFYGKVKGKMKPAVVKPKKK